MFTLIRQFCDAFADAVSPTWGLSRRAARVRRAMAEPKFRRAEELAEGRFSVGGFESAEPSPDADSWLKSKVSIASALEADRPEMNERVDSSVKNHELGLAHVEGRVERVAGVGMTLDPIIEAVEGLISEEEAELANEKLRTAWELCIRRIGRKREALWELLHLCVRYMERRGEFFILVGDQEDPLCPVTLKLEVIHPDRVETPPEKEGDPKVRMGIQLNDDNVPIGIWVRDSHPGDLLEYKETFTYFEMDQANGLPRVIHRFIRYDEDQHRGWARMQVGIKRLKNTDEYDEAEMERNYVAACNTAFVRSELPETDIQSAHGVITDSKGKKINEMSPGQITYLGVTDEVTFNNPSGPAATFEPYVDHQGRMYAAGAGSAYEIISGKWKGLTYSAGKILWNGEDGKVDILQLYLIEALIDIHRNFVTRCVISSRSIIDVDQAAYRSEPWHWWWVSVIPPRKRSIDPAREGRHDLTMVEAGVIPGSDIVERTNGQPARKVYKRIERDRKLRQQHGLEVHMPNMGRDEDGNGTNKPPTQPGDTNDASSDANSGQPAGAAS